MFLEEAGFGYTIKNKIHPVYEVTWNEHTRASGDFVDFNLDDLSQQGLCLSPDNIYYFPEPTIIRGALPDGVKIFTWFDAPKDAFDFSEDDLLGFRPKTPPKDGISLVIDAQGRRLKDATINGNGVAIFNAAIECSKIESTHGDGILLENCSIYYSDITLRTPGIGIMLVNDIPQFVEKATISGCRSPVYLHNVINYGTMIFGGEYKTRFNKFMGEVPTYYSSKEDDKNFNPSVRLEALRRNLDMLDISDMPPIGILHSCALLEAVSREILTSEDCIGDKVEAYRPNGLYNN
jgi:hypothetical protein